MPEFLAIVQYRDWDCEDPPICTMSHTGSEDDIGDWVRDCFVIEREKEIVAVECYRRENNNYIRIATWTSCR